METHFVPKSSRTNTPLSTYQMIGIAEGFEKCDNHELEIEAWASIGQKKLYMGLQGHFGRTLQRFIDEEILFDDFTINWDMVDEMVIYGGE